MEDSAIETRKALRRAYGVFGLCLGESGFLGEVQVSKQTDIFFILEKYKKKTNHTEIKFGADVDLTFIDFDVVR